MRVEQFLRDSAARFPDKTALVAGGRRLTFAELDAALRSARRGAARRAASRAAIASSSSWTIAGRRWSSIFAVLKAGAVFSPINPSTKADKLAYVLNNCRRGGDPHAARSSLAVAADALPRPPARRADDASSPAARRRPAAAARRSSDVLRSAECAALPRRGIDIDLAMLIYTSGSTGFPKGVMMTHQNVVAAATSITTYLENTADDVILNVLPISFDYGLYQVLMAVKVGATLVLEKSFAFPQAIFKRMREEKVTGFPLVPTMAALLLQMQDLAAGRASRTCATSPTPPRRCRRRTSQRLQELFPRRALYSMYGLTECKRCT